MTGQSHVSRTVASTASIPPTVVETSKSSGRRLRLILPGTLRKVASLVESWQIK